MVGAIFETGGKQYHIKEGDELYIEKLGIEDDKKVKFDKVLVVFKDDTSKIGSPYIKGASVTATVMKTGKAKKIIVYKMRPKKGYRRKQGHRQPYTKIKIDKISLKATAAKSKESKDGDE